MARGRPEPLETGGRRTVRCAVYTRKSSEQGLEQDFNSLEAQREAAEAYILSQRHEGWRLVKTRYDDGGFSGGTLERPAVKQLLADIGHRRIDVVVVYKVDRLTRSLSDFAKLVETFDAHGVSFVSVTQQFNTTSSMGRLTLNVLLSFAQFEREVTGERIRDKFAASRAKGMWMGGHPPLGYDLKDRKLIANENEAKLVRHIFERFCALGTVAKLKAALNRQGCRTKARVSAAGRNFGGTPFTRGALYHILHNRAYLGDVEHKGKVYPGQHAAIVPQGLWDRAHAILARNRNSRRGDQRSASPSLLKGLLFDDAGNRMSPSHAVKRGKRYRYYVSQAILQHRSQDAGSMARVPAHEIEDLVGQQVMMLIGDSERLIGHLKIDANELRQQLIRVCRTLARNSGDRRSALIHALIRTALARVCIGETGIEIDLSRSRFIEHVLSRPSETADKCSVPAEMPTDPDDIATLRVAVSWKRRGGAATILAPAGQPLTQAKPSNALIRAVARGHVWAQQLIAGEIASLRVLSRLASLPERYVSRIVRLGFLAPDQVRDILDGRQSADLCLAALWDSPLTWIPKRNQLV